MEAALIGLAGVLIGALLSEAFRRQRRVETFLEKVFASRFDTYVELANLLGVSYGKALAAIDDDTKSAKALADIAHDLSYEVAKFCDQHILYLHDDVCDPCIGVFETVRSSASITVDAAMRKEMATAVNGAYTVALRRIRDYSGVTQIEVTMKRIAKPKQ